METKLNSMAEGALNDAVTHIAQAHAQIRKLKFVELGDEMNERVLGALDLTEGLGLHLVGLCDVINVYCNNQHNV